MKKLEELYKEIEAKKPFWGAYPCLAASVRRKGFTRKTISKVFDKVMSKNDYFRKEKQALLDNLEALSRVPDVLGGKSK